MSKRILFVINTLGLAGAEVAMMELLSRMQDRYEVDLYVLTGQGELVDRLPEKVHLLNKRFNSKSVLSGSGRLHLAGTVCRALFTRGTVIKLFPYLVKNFIAMAKARRIQIDKLMWRVLSDGGMHIDKEYDLAIAFLEGGASYFVADHVKAYRKVAFIHIDYTQAGYTRELDKDCYLQFDVLFPIAEEIRDRFQSVYPECADRTYIFHNIINRERIVRLARSQGGFTDDYKGKRILTVGRLTKQKAYPIAIEAMKLLKERGVEAKWYVLGEGSERHALEQLIEEYGLEDDFILLGQIDNPFPYYRQADLYVHATQYEGKSIAIQEAQVLGCAVVASDCTGNREQIVEGEDGMLCELDAADVSRKVGELLADDEKRMKFGKAAARKNVIYEEDIRLLTALIYMRRREE